MTGWARWSTGNWARNLNWPWEQWYMLNPKSIVRDFEIQMDHLISTIKPDLMINKKKKKRTCRVVDFAVPADHRVKSKESEKDNTWTFPGKWKKKLGNMKVAVIPIVLALGTVNKGLVQGLKNLEIRGRIVTIQIMGLLRSARILRTVLVTRRNLLSLKLQWKPSTNAGVKNFQ